MLEDFHCYWCSDKESFAAAMAAITPCIHFSLLAWNQSCYKTAKNRWSMDT